MYTETQLITDITAMITTNAPIVIGIAIILAVARFIINWVFSSLNILTDSVK